MAEIVARSGLERALAPCDASLRRALVLRTSAGLLCTAMLAAVVVVDCATDLRAARADLFDIKSFRQVVDTANGLSAERGPANSVMGEESLPATASRLQLADKRARNDVALAALAVRLATWTASRGGQVGPHALDDIRDKLAAARDAVDRVADTPLPARDVAAVRTAVQGMFTIVDAFAQVTAGVAQDVLRRHDGIRAQVLEAEMLGDLREYAGRVASDIMPSVTARQRIRTDDLVASSRTRGRLSEIWSLVGHRGSLDVDDDAGVAAQRAAVEREFFGDGLALLDGVIAQGVSTGVYALSPTDLTRRFVPTLVPIERLRTAFLDAWVARSATASRRALAILVVAGLCIGVVMATLVGLAWCAQRHILAPLLVARDQVIALAEDRAATPGALRPPRGEMRRLFEAIAILQDRIRDRALLTQQLRRQADTDLLTDLPNRRALHGAAERLFAGSDGEAGIGLVMIDLDHFKAINDRHGHPAGDEVLRQVAACLDGSVAKGCTVARFGGEEFAVLVPACDLAAAVAVANVIRSALLAREVAIAGDRSIRLTASFGVAAMQRGSGDWDGLLALADAALYRAKSEGRDRVSWIAPEPGCARPSAGRSGVHAA